MTTWCDYCAMYENYRGDELERYRGNHSRYLDASVVDCKGCRMATVCAPFPVEMNRYKILSQFLLVL